MKNKKIASISVIYWGTQITFWIYSVVAVAVSFLAIALIVGFLGDSLELHTSMLTSVDLIKPGVLNWNGESMQVELVELYGKIHFINTPGKIGRIYGLFILPVLWTTFYIFFSFRQFIGNIYKGVFFENENVRLLKKMSFSLVALWLQIALYANFQYYWILKNVQIEGAEVTGKIEFHMLYLVGALMMMILAHIFQYGTELQSDNELTI